MQTIDQISQQLQARLSGTAYTVTRTDEGLLLHLQVADLRWMGLLKAHGLSKEYSIELQLREDEHIYQRQQIVRTVSWAAGVGPGDAIAQISTQRGVVKGTVYEKDFNAQVGFNERGRPVAVGYAFDSRWLSQTVDEVMHDTSWRKEMDPATRMGLIVAVAAVGFVLLLGIIALVIVFLL